MAICAECGRTISFFKQLTDTFKTSRHMCPECTKRLKLDALEKGQYYYWTEEDFAKYKSYLAKTQPRLKEQFVFNGGLYNATEDTGYKYDKEHGIIYFIQYDLYIETKKQIFFEMLPTTAKINLVVSDTYGVNSIKDEKSDIEVHFGFLDPYFKHISYKFLTKQPLMPLNCHCNVYSLFIETSQELVNAYYNVQDFTLGLFGLPAIADKLGDSWEQKETARCHFIEERAAFACYLYRKNYISEKVFNEVLWVITKNPIIFGLMYTKYKDYSPYDRPVEMKAFGAKYCGEQEDEVHYNPSEKSTIISNEELFNIPKSILFDYSVPSTKDYKTQYEKSPDGKEEKHAANFINYYRAVGFCPQVRYEDVYIDPTKGLFTISRSKLKFGQHAKSQFIYDFTEVTDYEIFTYDIYRSNNSDGKPVVRGKVRVKFDYESTWYDCSISAKVFDDIFPLEYVPSRKNNTGLKTSAYEYNSYVERGVQRYFDDITEAFDEWRLNDYRQYRFKEDFEDYDQVLIYLNCILRKDYEKKLQAPLIAPEYVPAARPSTIDKAVPTAVPAPTEARRVENNNQEVRTHKFCTQCGTKLKLENKFCINCGAKL